LKSRSVRTIGAINDQPYNAKPTHEEMILTHIEAGLECIELSVEFGLQKSERLDSSLQAKAFDSTY